MAPQAGQSPVLLGHAAMPGVGDTLFPPPQADAAGPAFRTAAAPPIVD